VHNNLGYHHYLRGNREKARRHFNAALQMDPDNTQVRNNLKLLDTS
ncbi:MAG: tetratricopeptide repeat protein, partial [Alphaproteobacteria bacterium]